MTTAFYAPPEAFRGDYVVLPEDEARHAVRVLRLSAGDELVVVDGVGGRHRVRLDHATKREAAGAVLETCRETGEAPYALTLGVGLLKNRNRFETILEKAAELGVRRVVPLLTARTEKESLREERARNILVAAMKQSGRSRLVELEVPQPLEALVQNPEDGGLRLACAMEAPEERSLLDEVQRAEENTQIEILIGPEGGFAPEEVKRVQEAGYRLVSLGRRRLRAETAAITAAAGVMLALG